MASPRPVPRGLPLTYGSNSRPSSSLRNPGPLSPTQITAVAAPSARCCSVLISTQPLSDGGGNLREALTSLYGLFAITRESLKAGRPSAALVAGGHSVEYLAITMLNRELRPFLSKWHPLLRDFEQSHPSGPESIWTHNSACRKELELVRRNIIGYTLGFARLADVCDTEAMFRGPYDVSGPGEEPRNAGR